MSKNKFKNVKKLITKIFIIILLSSLLSFIVNKFKNTQNIHQNNTTVNENINFQSNIFSSEDLHSSNAILVSLNDNEVLFSKDSSEKIYPASLTKIMTTIVAIENLNDLNEKVHLSSKMFNKLFAEGASMSGFRGNDEILAIDLLYGVMLPSGAESSVGLAEYIAGSEKNFVSLMNEKAIELGMNNTNFVNTTGLHHNMHYSTVSDLAKLLSYALKNDTFKSIFTSKTYTTGPTKSDPDGINFTSTMFRNLHTDTFSNGSILGGKTGYTKEAQLCLASLASIDAKNYILITTNAKGDHYTEQFNITDAYNIYNMISNSF